MACSIAIVGGGPGGLMAAWHLKTKLRSLADLTIFEASDRLGGKIMTRRFGRDNAMYEAGVAEIYGYTELGPDPLNQLITGFGLDTVPMDSDAVVLDRHIAHGVDGMRARYGRKTADAITAFRQLCAGQLSPAQYYEGVGKIDNDHPLQWENAEDVLNRDVLDDKARTFFRVMARSDIAADSHLTTGLNALKNYLMDVDGYIDVYSIVGGNESLIDGLAGAIDAKVKLRHRALAVGKGEEGYTLTLSTPEGIVTQQFDIVLLCLPHNWLATLRYDNETLRRAMSRHVAYFDRPAHYIRLAVQFDRPFWEGKVHGSWFMTEAFGGSCVYIEGARHDVGGSGIFNWLIPGSDALAYVNASEADLLETALATLPVEFGDPRPHVVEARVHRWISSVNAVPGGTPVRDPVTNHRPEPKEHPGVFVVGDYLFDSTLNGLLDSSDMATDMVLTEMVKQRYLSGESHRAALEKDPSLTLSPPSRRVDKAFYDNFRGVGRYDAVWSRFHDPDYIIAMTRAAFDLGPKFRMLVTGSGSGQLVEALKSRGIDAMGYEPNRIIHARTPESLKAINAHGPLNALPFADQSFDVIYDTALAYAPVRSIRRAIAEMHRVAKVGVYFATVTSDAGFSLLSRYDLLRGVSKLASWWEWSELFFEEEFDLSADDPARLEKLWQITLQAGRGPGTWYEDADSVRYCFYNRHTAK